MSKKYILLLICFFIILAAFLFYYFKESNPNQESKKLELNLSNQITQKGQRYENPITGEVVISETKPQYLNNRPLAVMVNNAVPARPQIGLDKADIVYEIVAEGGITRFLSVYYSEIPEIVGPIRSVREYYLVFLKDLGDAMLMHIGYSPQALTKISEWKISSLGLMGADFYRDSRGNPDVATEHTAFAKGKDLMTFAEASKLNYPVTIESWKFDDNNEYSNNPNASKVKIDFWYEGEYSGYFQYDSNSKEYIRFSGVVDNTPQILLDGNTKSQIKVKNLVVQFAEEFPIPNDDKGRLDYALLGSGKALVFREGKVIEAVWKKDGLNNRTRFYDLSEKEIEFARGKFWVSVVPSRNENQVKYTE